MYKDSEMCNSMLYHVMLRMILNNIDIIHLKRLIVEPEDIRLKKMNFLYRFFSGMTNVTMKPESFDILIKNTDAYSCNYYSGLLVNDF